ncbi:hypothetical protein ARMGADRAFT_1046783 [Armillaria gallica]|uniref:Helitron helicase-like domain-containing protein n=1 Tax=Armillaria gallica TaxID=47427 RepID=A0A2H3DIC0_ARMGA|nr:hypothetical protein ARMGADRAFT_1046783 [Armillaria gallica]
MHSKPLAVNGARVRRALIWLRANNLLYCDIVFNEEVLQEIELNPTLPIAIQHVLPSDTGEALTSCYEAPTTTSRLDISPPKEVPFENVVITNIKGGGYTEILHNSIPVNEFYNPSLFHMMYPTLFSYGVGGLEDKSSHVKHLFNLNNTRFQKHHSFLCTMLLHTSLKVKRADFWDVASRFANVTEQVGNGDFITADNDDEHQALELMHGVRAVTANMAGSSSLHSVMRNEIRGLTIDKGLPSFYITINLADVYNPIVKFLSGDNIDLNSLLPGDVPKFRDQSILVAKNPAIAVCILGYMGEDLAVSEGALGAVKVHYGCVEAQGRGTLHCHMLVWLHGALNPNEIKQRINEGGDIQFHDRLLHYLDEILSNSILSEPDSHDTVMSDGFHAASICRSDAGIHDGQVDSNRKQQNVCNLVIDCQVHNHCKTFYKYWCYPEPKVC